MGRKKLNHFQNGKTIFGEYIASLVDELVTPSRNKKKLAAKKA